VTVSGGKSREGEVEDEQVQALWYDYLTNHSHDSRDSLVLHYSSLVKYVASGVARSVPPSIEFGDLMSYGTFGLLDALEGYDVGKGVPFEGYAMKRIRGAMLDGLRSEDWAPRSLRSGGREINRAYEELYGELIRTPTDEEVADRLGMDTREYADLRGKLSLVSVMALDRPLPVVSDGSGEISLGDTIADEHAADPPEALEKEELRDRIALAIDQLPERQRAVIALHYVEGLSTAQIADALSVSGNRVRQMHTRAIIRLRASLSVTLLDAV